MSQVQNIFFAKTNIAELNNIILNKTEATNLIQDGRKEIINLLIKNMKTIYKSIDVDKINNNNFNSILEQFKKHSVYETINELSKSNLLSKYQNKIVPQVAQVAKSNASTLKFNRDFHSNPNNGVVYVDRPQSSKHTGQINDDKPPQKMTSSLDNAFKPIINDISNELKNYDSNKNTNIQLDDIQVSRNHEIGGNRARPSTPDFLKSTKTNSNRNTSQQIETKTKVKTESNDSFFGLANDTAGDLFSLDNIDKPLIESQYVEDTSNFDDRLKRLNSERGDISIPQNTNIDFTSENFKSNQSINDNTITKSQQSERMVNHQLATQPNVTNNTSDDRYREQLKQQQLQLMQQKQQEQMQQKQQEQLELKQKELQLREEQMQRELQMREEQMQREFQKQLQLKEKELENKMKLKEQNMHMQNMHIQPMPKQPMAMKQPMQMMLQPKPIKQPMQMMQMMQQPKQNMQMKQPIHNKIQMKQIKPTQAKQMMEINYSNPLENIEEFSDNYDSPQYDVLKIKEQELLEKNIQFEKLLNNYNHLFNVDYLHVEVSEPNCKSNYSFPLDTITNVKSIKLTHYSLPEIQFNIEENKNNYIVVCQNDVETKYIINRGKYTIDTLLEVLNNKLKNIKFYLNLDQTIKIESDEVFDLLSCPLLKNNLGFINPTLNKSSYISDNIWDLRIDNKIYLYINNLSDTVPFGILFNGTNNSNCEFKFKEPFDIECIDIVFKDSKGALYNFYNLQHTLSFVIYRLSKVD